MVYDISQGQMDKIDELLPGLEDFLSVTLANESLSEPAEESRLYFVERLDILKLPPSLPPRASAVVAVPPTSPIKREVKSPSPSCPVVVEEDDFAAYQRELSRSLISKEDLTGALDTDSEDEMGVKVYDDIDLQDQGENHRKCSMGGDDTNLYEIPVLKRLSCQEENNNGYEESKGTEKKSTDSLATDAAAKETEEFKPPPLPPRRDRTSSDAHSRSSIGSALEEAVASRPPSLPIRPTLAPKSVIQNMATEKCDSKSEKSVNTIDEDLDELDGGTSYESYEDETQLDTEMMNKLNIKLPKPLKKSNKKSKHSKTRSSKEWDVTLPFHCLEEVTLSGEVHYKGKISWSRKLVALTEGRMVCYKHDKPDCKPALVINLLKYEASYTERDNRKGFDIRLVHPALEMHHFSVDFKDWANMWCEYIGAMAQGKPPPGQYHHLARGNTFTGLDSSHVYGSKTNLGHSVSNISTCSSADNLDFDSSSLKKKKRKNSRKVNRMGSIAFRATQFFESIGKKSGKRMIPTSASASASLGHVKEHISSSASSTGFSPLPTPTSLPDTPVFITPEPPKPSNSNGVTYQGYLIIFSSFNRRRWGKRWCVIRKNMFECYKNELSTVCELEIWLRTCVLKRAVDETKSQLGLMLVEKNVEKITIEPVTPEEMTGWLSVLMNETMTQEVPDGLEEFWVEDPYNDIKSDDLNSPMSDVFGYSTVDERTFNWSPSNHHYDFGDAEEADESNVTLRSHSDSDKQTVCVNQGSLEETHIPGEMTGELYSQVQRKSSTLTQKDVDNAAMNSNIEMPTEVDSVGNSYPGSPGSFGASFDHGSESTEGSMFAEIITKINRHFSREDEQRTDSDSEKNTDTAYNSAVCSENSSLERKNRSGQASLSHSQNNLENVNHCDSPNNDLDTLSQVTDIMVSPMENSQQTFGSKEEVADTSQVDDGVALMDQDQSEINNDDVVITTTSRDQCDSAIYEADSLTDADMKTIIHRIEQLRTHLVKLKEKRISVRDSKNQTSNHGELENLEEEYRQLDDECRTVSEQIVMLEQQIQS